MLKVVPPLLASFTLLLPTVLFAQHSATTPKLLPVISMPSDRATDSYLIYSSLIPLGETAGKDWPHEVWLLQDATIALIPADQPCLGTPETKSESRFSSSMNPHFAVHPPEDRNQDFKEILADFDAHCHERLALRLGNWNTLAPVRLLTPEEQEEFRATQFPKTAASEKYRGAAALYGFSEVYFNVHHTVALVYATHWCGGLCGEGFWVPLAAERPLEAAPVEFDPLDILTTSRVL